MNILLSNDDGYDSRGITALKKSLNKKHTVFIAAPLSDLSGSSQAITLFRDISVKTKGERTFMVDGFPADCVNLAIQGSLFPEKIDLVISGINKGVNMGQDIWYSGTVGAARQGFIHGFNSIAISCDYSSSHDAYKTVADFLCNFIDSIGDSCKRPFFLNINYPPREKIAGIQWTKLGQRIYRDSYSNLYDRSGNRSFKFNASELSHISQENSDFNAYYHGYVSITPLSLDATDHYALGAINYTSETISKK